jgi:hypothetical protein
MPLWEVRSNIWGHHFKGRGQSRPKEDSSKLWIGLHLEILKDLGFLGLAGYYRKYLKGYDITAAPMSNLLGDAFQGDEGATKAFEHLKLTLYLPPS